MSANAYREIAAFLEDNTSYRPKIGIICGSGLSELSKAMTATETFKYSDIPGFPMSTVQGHKGELVFGLLSGVPAVCLRGRFHSYEGYSMDLCALPVRVMRCLGVKVAIITNAAGGLNPENNVGDVVCITDHFALPNLAGKNCLVGHNDAELGPRFPPMSNAYDENLVDIVYKSAQKLSFDTFVRKGGTYCFVSGPMYESQSEARFLRGVGGDAVGMSTVPEVVAAHHCGIKVICLSLITNKVVTDDDPDAVAASHQEVLEAVQTRSAQIQELVKSVVSESKSYVSGLEELPAIDLSEARAKSKGGAVNLFSNPLFWLTVTTMGAMAIVKAKK